MQIYSIGTRLVAAASVTEAKEKLGIDYKASVLNLTPKLKALCDEVLGDQAFPTARPVDVLRQHQLRLSDGSYVYGEEETIKELKAQLFEADAFSRAADQHFADLELERIAHGRSRDRIEELFKQKTEADERAATMGRELAEGAGAAAQLATRVVELEKQVAIIGDTAKRRLDQIGHLNKRLVAKDEELMERPTQERLDFAHSVVEKLEAEIARLNDEVAAWKNLAPIETTPAEKQADATKAFLSSKDIAAAEPTPPPVANTAALSPLAQKHGEAVMQLLDSGHNPDEICAELNGSLSRNDQLNPALIKRIKVEMTPLRRAAKAVA